MILDHINSPADIKRLNGEQTQHLCEELRSFLVENVAHTGGHLASNLGVVELTVAIHRVFDTEYDRLVFDVGHQCYVHKILTGRRERFSTLRQTDGLSGFPKPRESVHDAFIAGHASNSISVALGMARARTLLHEKYHVLALLGDGALTGGMSMEGLNDAGASGEPMLVILNDNGMSISHNVGGLSGYLSRLRIKPEYFALKKKYRKVMTTSAAGKQVYRASHSLKTALKNTILPGGTVFENMGFTYLGPVDGHDVEALTQLLRQAKDVNGPVLLHVSTVKGKGYQPAETEPGRFHGIGPFDPDTGADSRKQGSDFSAVFGRELAALARQDRRICAITAAMRDGTGLNDFAAEFPERFFDVGIAEEHAVAMAAGMAKQGMRPVFAVYSTFLQRGFDQMLHDVSLQGLHVVFAVDRAGLVGADGETHHGCFDVGYLAQIPGMTVFSPSNYAELRAMLYQAIYDVKGPVAIRYPRGGEGSYQSGEDAVRPWKELRCGNDCTILSYGIMIDKALAAAALLHEKGIEAQIVKLNRIAPLEGGEICELLRGKRLVLVLEDSLACGCVGQRLAALLACEKALPDRLILQNLGETVPDHGTVEQLYGRCGMDAPSVAARIEEALTR